VYRLDASSVEGWVDEEQGREWSRRPDTFDSVCPHCGRVANFQIRDAFADPERRTVSMTARCARCRNNVHLWSIDGGGELYMRPAPAARHPIAGAESMPTAVRQAYQDTIDVFNAGVWSATATQTRRTLEGIVHELLPAEERRGPLAQQLRKLAESVDLAQPLITLSNALRESGNIGAHFDLTRTTDRATAQAMLDLIDYLIEYIYALPEMIEELNRKVQQLDREGDDQDDA
jgi:Domain of unknown function (DUF4145)